MVTLRVSTATAIPTALQLSIDLARWIRQTGPLSSLQGPLQQVEALQAWLSERPILVDLAWGAAPGNECGRAVWSWLTGGVSGAVPDLPKTPVTVNVPVGENGPSFAIRFFTLPLLPQLLLGGMGTPFLVVVLTALPEPDSLEWLAIERLVDDRPRVWLIAPGIETSTEPLLSRVRTLAWYVEQVDLATLPAPFLPNRLQEKEWMGAFDILCAHAAATALQNLTEVTSLAIEQETRTIKARRAVAQQRAVRTQNAGQLLANDILTEARSRIQRNFNDFQRGVTDRLARFLAFPSGVAWRLVEEELSAMGDLAREVKTRVVALRVPDALVARLRQRLNELIVNHCVADLLALVDLFRILERELGETVSAAGGPLVTFNIQHLTDDRIERLLEGQFLFDRVYRGELPRPGFFEYAMVARRYQMVLVMFLSAFGLSFLRTLKQFMIPTAILLLTLGAVAVANSAKKERVEALQREMEKAADAVRNECKRSYNDIQRAWSSILSTHLADQATVLLAQIESAVKDFQSRRTAEIAEEKQRLQHQLQTLEIAEKRLAAAEKGREAVASAVSQLRGEARQLSLSIIRGERRG